MNSECGMRKEKKRTEDRGQMKEGERLGRWEGEIKPGQRSDGRGQGSEVRDRITAIN